MRDKSHEEQVERWANFVKNNRDWKAKLKPFLDSQIIIARRFYANLLKTKSGAEKVRELRRLK